MTTGTEAAPPVIGVAIANRTGERRLLTVSEYHALDRRSEARWEFWGVRVDPATHEPLEEDLREWGFEPGGPTVIPGEMVEVEPGMFRPVGG